MSLAAIISILAGAAKAFPTFARWVDEVVAAWAQYRSDAAKTADYEAIDSAIAAARAQPWVCPAACPHRLQHGSDSAGQTAAGPS